jgi:Raf kinase inhibitor-like YbhB/YbcL family protein
MAHRHAIALAALAIAASPGCGDETVDGPAPAAPDRLRVSSSAFAAGGSIPVRFTCAGGGVSPPLAWRGVPARARALALLLEDPDASGGTFVHWTLYDISPRATGMRAGAAPAGSREGTNSFGDRGYGGPCPPEGDAPHRYVFALYALRSPLGLEPGSAPDDVRAAIAERAIARGRLTGRFGR